MSDHAPLANLIIFCHSKRVRKKNSSFFVFAFTIIVLFNIIAQKSAHSASPLLETVGGATTFPINTKFTLNCKNLLPDTAYPVWWDGDILRSATCGSTTGGETSVQIESSIAGDRKICMAEDAPLGTEGCDYSITVTIIIPPTPSPTTTPPPPPGPPCAEWQGGNKSSGVCDKIATSLPMGNISTKPGEFIAKITSIILGVAGGIALLLIISAGYKIMTSKGKPEAIQEGRDKLISAIVGLVFIIFSFVIFQLITVDILKIPEINK